jgi:hypothetical protein
MPWKKAMPDEDRFWLKVRKTDSCWLWEGTRSRGYGQFRMDRRGVLAHRLAWVFTNGSIPNGMFVCHHCDVKLCVNPSHLFIGTHADNMRDRNEKGRQAKGIKVYNKFPPKGERNPRAILTWQQVNEIRRRRELGETGRNLAREFNVSDKNISRIVLGQTWIVPEWNP